MWLKAFQLLSLVIVLTGTWLLAFGLKVRGGLSKELDKEIRPEEKGPVAPSEVRQHPALFWTGLGLITAGVVLEAVLLMLA